MNETYTVVGTKPRRLLRFREWCELVYEPSKRMREEYARGRYSEWGGYLWDRWN
jgi:hypothetical protein